MSLASADLIADWWRALGAADTAVAAATAIKVFTLREQIDLGKGLRAERRWLTSFIDEDRLQPQVRETAARIESLPDGHRALSAVDHSGGEEVDGTDGLDPTRLRNGRRGRRAAVALRPAGRDGQRSGILSSRPV